LLVDNHGGRDGLVGDRLLGDGFFDRRSRGGFERLGERRRRGLARMSMAKIDAIVAKARKARSRAGAG
jgi:hypothetical protein